MLIPGCGAARAVPAGGQGYTTAAQQAVGLEMVQTWESQPHKSYGINTNPAAPFSSCLPRPRAGSSRFSRAVYHHTAAQWFAEQMKSERSANEAEA